MQQRSYIIRKHHQNMANPSPRFGQIRCSDRLRQMFFGEPNGTFSQHEVSCERRRRTSGRVDPSLAFPSTLAESLLLQLAAKCTVSKNRLLAPLVPDAAAVDPVQG